MRYCCVLVYYAWSSLLALASGADIEYDSTSLKQNGIEVAADLEDETCLLQKDTKIAGRSKMAKEEHPAHASEVIFPHLSLPTHNQKKEKQRKAHLAVREAAAFGYNESQSEDNRSYGERLYNEIEFEVSTSKDEPPTKNKFLLLMLEITIVPAFLGIDRCYMEQPCLGVLKALTFSGLGFWGIIDTVVVMFNAASKMRTIHTIGFVASFDKESTVLGFYIGTAWLSIWALCCCCSIWCGATMPLGVKNKGQMPPEPKESEENLWETQGESLGDSRASSKK